MMEIWIKLLWEKKKYVHLSKVGVPPFFNSKMGFSNDLLSCLHGDKQLKGVSQKQKIETPRKE